MSLARQLELREQYASAAAKAPSWGFLSSPLPRFALPAAPAEKAALAMIPVGGQPVKRLEQEERRRLGLCFNCNEKYTRGHNRVCRRIFYIGGFKIGDEAGDADEPGPEAPVFSLHAIAGVAVGNTVQLKVLLGTATFVALVDTGSTHSFIGEAAARCTRLHIEPRPRLTAIVANGERVACPGVLRQAPVIINGMEFHVDLYVMPLAGYDVVLGTLDGHVGAHRLGSRGPDHGVPAGGP
jgi:hypothetical protein